jgi:hypothetical protein
VVRGCFGLVGDASVILLVLGDEISYLIEIQWFYLFGFFLQETVVEGFFPTDPVLFVYLEAPFDEIL